MATKVFIQSSDSVDYNNTTDAARIATQLEELAALLKDGGAELEFSTRSFFNRTSTSNSLIQLQVVGENKKAFALSILIDYRGDGAKLFDELKRQGRTRKPGRGNAFVSMPELSRRRNDR